MKKVITYGTFDLFHEGHLNLLKQAKSLGNYLIVGITSDYFDKCRGKYNVHDSLMTRISNVQETGLADEIVIEEYFGQKIDDIKKYGIDIFTVGSDWVGYFDYLREYCEVIYSKRTKGISSTQIRNTHSLKLGIIGGEKIVDRFLSEVSFISGVSITGVYYAGPVSSEKCKELYQYNSLNEFFSQSDAVYVNVPLKYRYKHIKESLLNGKHVLTEFPFSNNYDNAKELIELANARNLVLMEGLKTAYCPAFTKMISLVKSGVIGNILNIEDEILNDSEVQELGENIINIEKYYGKPQDMEWAFEKGKLYILQSRPITTLKKANEKTANTIIWDNSNIVESYPEITLPLTFSFIRKAYSDVYKRFSEITGVPPKVVESYQVVYDNMLGLLKGRVYYNLINWYKLLMLFPNSRNNSKFMEQMMGVKKELSEEDINENLLEAEEKMSSWEKFRNRIEKLKAGTTLFLNMFLIENKAKKFYKLIDENLNGKNSRLEEKSVKDLKKYYKFLENKFLKNWEIPIINDFLVMVWFGLSKKAAEKYIKENFEEVHNILIAQEGSDMISVEPSKYIMKMSSIIKKDKDLQNEIKGIIEKTATDINIENLTRNKEFNSLLEEYMQKFGDRTVHELKLEALTLREDPLFLIRMVYSISMTKEVTEHSKRNISEEQNKIYENLKISPLKKFILKKTVSYAKKFIRLRENLRYERTKVFGMVRKIMKKIGTYLKEENIIVHERDVFYLTIDEIFGLIDGALIDTDLKKLIDLRKEKYKEYEEEAVLPDRFLTRGFLGENFHYEDLTGNEQGDKNILKGTGCSKGVVKGKVKIVLNLMNTEVEDGDIVVTKSTDPSWVMVFPLLKGLIVEKGSLLSHSAIISREMNIPAIVGVQGAVTALKTGDFVQFDGSTGIIKKLDEV